ncbi:MAG: SIMPL domain-containing protein [Bacteroidetes bacterium]|nr:SIMPL domain-containing protein [Bacteroidota bacterium]MBL0140171.1 SIMPL domain-containing protein [Bacteroidota bacterium]
MKHLLSILFILLANNLSAQTNDFPNERKITVNGVASVQIEPSEYIISIRIQEYFYHSSEDKGEAKVEYTIDALEGKLKDLISSLGFNLKNLHLVEISSNYSNSYGNERKPLISETFEYKLDNFSDVVRFLQNARINSITSLQVRRKYSIKKEELRTQLYKSALEDAKSTADKLLSTINKSTGDVLFINASNNQIQYNLDEEYQNNYSSVSTFNLNNNKTISMGVTVIYGIK